MATHQASPRELYSHIPAFGLYGETYAETELRFLHVESLDARNRLHDWGIRPHRHQDLHQLFWVKSGSGNAVFDETKVSIEAPALLTVPTLVVHGFQFVQGSEGLVLTLAESFRQDLITFADDVAIDDALSQPRLMPIPLILVASVEASFSSITKEYESERLSRTTAISGHLLAIFAVIARLQACAERASSGQRPGELLFKRFRAAIESRYQQHISVEDYASELGTTRRSLHRVCRVFANESPQRLIHRRLLLEAKRKLLYTTMSIGEIGYVLGFNEPSYFTHFFATQAGMSPLAFRQSRSCPQDVGGPE